MALPPIIGGKIAQRSHRIIDHDPGVRPERFRVRRQRGDGAALEGLGKILIAVKIWSFNPDE
jgi:hypothetical protein